MHDRLQEFDLRPRVRHLPGSAGLTREEIMSAEPAVLPVARTDQDREKGDNILLDLKPAEVRRIADERARARRSTVKEAIIGRLVKATRRGEAPDVPRDDDPVSRRQRAKIASVYREGLPPGKPLAEIPRASYVFEAPNTEVKPVEPDTTAHIQRQSGPLSPEAMEKWRADRARALEPHGVPPITPDLRRLEIRERVAKQFSRTGTTI